MILSPRFSPPSPAIECEIFFFPPLIFFSASTPIYSFSLPYHLFAKKLPPKHRGKIANRPLGERGFSLSSRGTLGDRTCPFKMTFVHVHMICNSGHEFTVHSCAHRDSSDLTNRVPQNPEGGDIRSLLCVRNAAPGKSSVPPTLPFFLSVFNSVRHHTLVTL